jgi:transmembrane 9 superfamily protein 2/4
MPYDYYALPFCTPKNVGLQSENIGEILSGDRIENSVYKLEMKSTKACQAACAVKLNQAQSNLFKNAIMEEYRAHWIVDNLPVGSYESYTDGSKYFSRGFPIGFTIKDLKKPNNPKVYIYNHFRIVLQYHDNTNVESEMELSLTTSGPVSPAKIVGFRVEPLSVKHTFTDTTFRPGKTVLNTCSNNVQPSAEDKNYQTVNKNDVIVFTYDVFWESSDTEWSNRWDVYISAETPDDKVHWFAITNSILVVIMLSVMIAMILVRALRKDIANYNDPSAVEEAKEESGWKLVHGDVFRPPQSYPMFLR